MTKQSIFFTLVFVILVSSVRLPAQQTRREVAHPSAADSKPNSSEVPDGYAINTHFTRVVVLRFKYDTDLLAGLKKMVEQEKIKNAVILAGIGSVRNYQVHQVGNRNFPLKDVFVKNPTGPADIISMNGYVINGRVHPHITMARPEGAFGGHLEDGTTVYTFAVVTLGVLEDNADLSKVDDWSYR